MSVFFSCCFSQWRFSKLSNTITKNVKYLNTRNINSFKGSTFIRQISHETSEDEKFVPFIDVINSRRKEARRSILVQVQSSQSFKELHTYCSSIGTVKNMFHYSTGVDPMHFIVVEFAEESDVTNILSQTSHLGESQGVPANSQFLWFRASNRKLAKLKQSKNAKLYVENGTQVMKDNEIKELLKSCENISDQIKVLHNATKLNDLGTRLRYLTARQIEMIVSGMFPFASAYPFGSSVNGCGKMGCDLDLVLRLVDKEEPDNSRLVFHCKAATGSERTTSQRHMEAIGDLIHLFLPGCSQVRRILQARVPIIKYYQQFADVECDLSMSNMSGVHMSDFLYIMGSMDSRVRPLIFAVRKWAREVGLTNNSPGRWISNFSLTLLVLSFLQRPLSSPAVLPTLNTLTKLAGPRDKYVTEDGIDCTFLRDVNNLDFKTKNDETLESLLCQFFEYYSQFDFASKSVCLNEAVALTKPEFSAMYIINPLEKGLNVSKNVSLEEVEKFKLEVKNAAWTLESQENKTSNWGLLSIMEGKTRPNPHLNFTFSNKHGRLMEVSTLFEEEKKENEKFKNDEVKHQVEKVKKETKQKIKELEVGVKIQKTQR